MTGNEQIMAQIPEIKIPLRIVPTFRKFRRFHLVREEDVSGTSGTGIVAEGCLFSTGKTVIAWTTRYTSVAMYDSLAELEAIHGHQGKTTITWIDPE